MVSSFFTIVKLGGFGIRRPARGRCARAVGHSGNESCAAWEGVAWTTLPPTTTIRRRRRSSRVGGAIANIPGVAHFGPSNRVDFPERLSPSIMKAPSATADIGLIGLAVMGENLVLNMESHGYTVAVFNRTTSKVDDFVNGRGQGQEHRRLPHASRSWSPRSKRPRKVMMMVKAGAPVDEVIEQLVPLLEPGDIIIDGGNTHFPDTNRRTQSLEGEGPALHRHRRLRRRGRGAARARPSCPAATPRPGRTSSRSSRRSPPRSPTARPAATGSGRRAPATSSRWSTTASSTATCS